MCYVYSFSKMELVAGISLLIPNIKARILILVTQPLNGQVLSFTTMEFFGFKITFQDGFNMTQVKTPKHVEEVLKRMNLPRDDYEG